MARIQSISQSFAVAQQKTLEATQKLLVATAKRKHAEVMAAEPRPTSFQRFVDGREGALEEAVKPFGVIVYRYPRIEAVVQFAMETLFDLSPVLSGDYRSGHQIFVDQAGARNLKDWRPGMEVAITNPLPYARKIELGSMKMKVPGSSAVYERARKKISARYGNQFQIKFTFRALVGGVSINQEAAASLGGNFGIAGFYPKRAASGLIETRLKKRAGNIHNRSELRFPCLIITER